MYKTIVRIDRKKENPDLDKLEKCRIIPPEAYNIVRTCIKNVSEDDALNFDKMLKIYKRYESDCSTRIIYTGKTNNGIYVNYLLQNIELK